MPVDPIEQPVETPPAEPQKVTFDEAQKARINEIVKEASARAGAEARAEVARLKAALPQDPQSTDALLRLAETQAELITLKSEAAEHKISEVLHKAAGTQDFFDKELASQILRSSVRMIDGKPVVVDGTGTPRLNSSDFTPMSPADLAKELAEQKKFLVRSGFVGGAGSVQNSSPSQANTVHLSTLFGKDSDGGAAQRLALRSPAAYRAARAEAVKQGLLSK
jgi:hypothetical protein